MPTFRFGSKEQKVHLKNIAKLGGYSKPRSTPLERFYLGHYKTESGCWIWTKGMGRGYGRFKVDGRLTLVTRWAYEYFKGIKISSPKVFVCHKCDVRACVNPDHLFLGSTQANMDDCRVKDRFKKGSKHPGSKLQENDIVVIRQLYKNGWSQQKIADKVGIAQAGVSRILLGTSWTHVL